MTKQPINVNVVLHSPYVSMERNGDLTDLTFCGLDKVFKNSDGKRIVGYEKDGYYVDPIYGEIEYFNDETQTLHYGKGSIFRVKLGFSMEMPKGKMAKAYPRSGTRKNFGVLLTNSVGNIDNAYCGNEDEWMAEFYAIESGSMKLGDRILQYEIVDISPDIIYNVVESFDNESRGGFGSSGIR